MSHSLCLLNVDREIGREEMWVFEFNLGFWVGICNDLVVFDRFIWRFFDCF
jgi:hypothetical protein